MVRAGKITLKGEDLPGAVLCEDLGSESCILLRGMLGLWVGRPPMEEGEGGRRAGFDGSGDNESVERQKKQKWRRLK